jgi:hypothetical protein
MEKISDDCDKIILLLQAMRKNPALLDMAVKYVS